MIVIMRKYVLIIGVMVLVLLTGCRKEDDLVPTKNAIDYFVIQDKPGRFNQLAYQIYEETGMPIFVNDTLGSEYRGEDAYGQPIIHYEIFMLEYTIESLTTQSKMIYSSDTNAMVKAAELIRDLVLPRLPKAREYRPYSIMLVDSIYSIGYAWSVKMGLPAHGKPDYAYKGLMGLGVGKLSDILKMSEDEQAYWAGRILATNIASNLQSLYGEELEKFYMVSARTETATYHDATYYADLDGVPVNVSNANYLVDYRTYGFTEWVWDGVYTSIADRRVRRYPSKSMDVANYIAMVYAYNQEKFETLYADFPLCIEKYKIMKDIVAKFEVKVNK